MLPKSGNKGLGEILSFVVAVDHYLIQCTHTQCRCKSTVVKLTKLRSVKFKYCELENCFPAEILENDYQCFFLSDLV